MASAQLTLASTNPTTTPVTPEGINGLSNVTKAISTIFQSDVAVTGMAKYLQLGFAAVVGDAFGYYAGSKGKIGLGITPSLSIEL